MGLFVGGVNGCPPNMCVINYGSNVTLIDLDNSSTK
jgi:hypothetical protein